jgi:hypothetical protein
MNKAMQETTLATQADFRPELLLTGAMVSGTHPISVPGGLLNRVWHLFDQAQNGKVNTDRVRELAASLPELRQIVEQYIAPATGKPRAECADSSNPAVVAMKEETACFGRKCGFAQGCFLQCSLGPSHAQDGKPLGVEGEAQAFNTSGQPLGPEKYKGVLKVDAQGNPLSPPRHRDNSCLTLTLFLRLIGVPPAPTASLSDALWLILPRALTAVEQGLQAQPLPTPQQQAAAVTKPQPALPAVAPLPPQQAVPQPQVPQQAPAPAPQQRPATPVNPPAGHALAPIFPGVSLSYDQQCELHALMYVLEHSQINPKSVKSIKNMEERHATAKKSPKAILAAWRGPCEDREMMIGTGVNARLKQEFWPQHIPQPAGYYTLEEPATAAPAATPAPRLATVQPQAPATPHQKIDYDESGPAAPSYRGGPVDISTVTLDPESKEALKAHTEAMTDLAAALRGLAFQGSGQQQNGGNQGGNHQPVQAPPQVHQAPPPQRQPTGVPAIPASPPAPAGYGGAGGFQPPPASASPPPPPTGFRDYGAPASVSSPIVDAGGPANIR